MVRQSRPVKIITTLFFIFLCLGGVIWFFSGVGYLVPDSAKTEVTENITSDKNDFIKTSGILSQDSRVMSAFLFVSDLENRLANSLAGANKNIPSGGPAEDSQISRLETASNNALVAQEPVLAIVPSGGISNFDNNGSILTYEVESGDTLQSIASDFGVSVDTLVGANNLNKNTKLKPGDKIAILPVDGVRHVVKSGDTIESIAVKYKADADRILAFNDLADNALIKPGDVLIIPGGEHVPISPQYAPAVIIPQQNLPDLPGYYGWPSGGRITFGLHKYNAIDVGGKDWCNTPLYAAAAGTVITADAQGWNGGYGKYIKIAHNNGTITLYAHSSQLLVSVGQFVNKGQTIALMGSTGRATGCHVHFEVRGARNPLANY